jgi:hypothetical protein
MRNISFRAKDASEAGKRLEDALNTDSAPKMGRERLQEFADAIGPLLELMPAGRQVAVSVSLSDGSEPEGDGRERVRVRVATVTDRESGSLAQRMGGAEAGDASSELSAGEEQHSREVAAAEQAERDRLAREAQSNADALRNTPPEGAGVKPGDPVAG